MRRIPLLIVCLGLTASTALAQQRGGRAKPPSKPTPHWVDGRVNFSAAPGEKGYWGTGPGNLSENQIPMSGAFLVNPSDIDKIAPFQPWAKELVKYRLDTLGKDDPHPRCVAPGGPRQFMTPYGVEIIDQPELKKM